MNQFHTAVHSIKDVGDHRSRKVLDIIKIHSVQEVREALQEASQQKVPIYATSTGCNWGMGSRQPVVDHCKVLDLKPMNQIRTLDLERGYAVIEPGVTQRQLSEALEGTPWILNVTASCADSSVLGNALDRGDGTIRSRVEDILGVEAVLANGEVITTGGLNRENRYDGRPAGPDLTQLLVQSNLGVVTAMAVSLIPRPETIHLFYGKFKKESAIRGLEKLVQLYRQGLPTKGLPRMRELYLVPKEGSYLLPAGANEEHYVMMLPLLGSEEAVKVAQNQLTEAFQHFDGVEQIRFLDALHTPEDDPLYPRTLMARGIPNCLPIRRGLRTHSCDLDHGSMGFLTFLPLVGLDQKNPARAIEYLQAAVDEHPTALAAEFNIVSTHTANMVVQISYERSSEEIDRAHAMRNSARKRFLQAGLYPYRSNIDHIDHEMTDRGNSDHLLLDAIKKLVDPNNLISPGRYLTPRGFGL